MKSKLKLLVLLLLIAAIGAFFVFDLGQYLSADYINSQLDQFKAYYAENMFFVIGVYMAIYVGVTAFSLPGAAIMTLVGGALFGLVIGVIAVSFASSIGATLAFLLARFLLGESIQKKYGDKLKKFNDGVEEEGAFYLFALRLVPLFPFFVINVLMGLTKMKTWQFYIVSQVGMLPGTAAFIYLGSTLAKIDPANIKFPPELLIAFTLLAVVPFISKKLVNVMRRRKLVKSTTKNYPKPKKFDYNLVVIGAGSAGLVSSYIAATLNAKVALIEKHKMGGDCLNTGCVPSKALLRTAKVLHYAKRAEDFGLKSGHFEFDFAEVMERIQNVVKKIEPHDSVERYTKLGVECIQGAANIKSNYEVEVNGRTLTTRSIIIATGARPFVPPIPGLDNIPYLTSDNIWDLREQPERLLVIGGGSIGCELAQAFQRLGTQVTLVELNPRIMPRDDEDVSLAVMEKFKKEGIELLTSHAAVEFKGNEGCHQLIVESEGLKKELDFDKVLIAVGRKPNTEGFGVEELGINLRGNGTIEADPFLRTNYPNIFVCGDITGPYQFTHTAAHQAYYACVNALFRPFTDVWIPAPFDKSFRVDYSVIPWATFTDPEVGQVGLNEKMANDHGIPYEVTRYDLDDLDRAIADSEDHGFVKVLTKPGTDKILGATIVGNHASDLIGEFISAMKNGFGLGKILGTIHIYPSMSEANKYLAGNWKKARKPLKTLERVRKFNTWLRG